jgi:hypothetical protein
MRITEKVKERGHIKSRHEREVSRVSADNTQSALNALIAIAPKILGKRVTPTESEVKKATKLHSVTRPPKRRALTMTSALNAKRTGILPKVIQTTCSDNCVILSALNLIGVL